MWLDKHFSTGDLVKIKDEKWASMYCTCPANPEDTNIDDIVTINGKSLMMIIVQVNEYYYLVFNSDIRKFGFIWHRWLINVAR